MKRQFKNIRKALKQEYDKRFNESLLTVDKVSEYHKTKEDSLNHFVRWSLDKRQSYKGTHEEQKQKALKRYKQILDKRLNKELDHLSWIESAQEKKPFKGDFYITIEWFKGGMGANQARATDSDGNISGSTGGYGYDKESTATARILNQHKEILYLMCKNKDYEIEKSNRDVLGYGSGYGIIPRFEGGVGVSSHTTILKRIGYNMEKVSWTNKTDVYKVEVL